MARRNPVQGPRYRHRHRARGSRQDFPEFEQAETGASQADGAGLGLAIVKRIVERHAGPHRRSKARRAQAACSRLPCRCRPRRTPSEHRPSPHRISPHRAIMIVAPSHVEAALLARRLTRWGARVAIAPNESRGAGLAAGARLERGADRSCARQRRDRHAARRHPQRAVPACHHHAAGPLRTRRSEGARLQRLSGEAGARRFARRTPAHGWRRLRADLPTNSRELPNFGTARKDGLSILVAEDNEINALLTRALLQKLGHRPQVVASGHAAMESFLAANACRLAVRPDPDGCAHERHRWHRSDATHPRDRGEGRQPPHADRCAHRQCACRSIARPASPPAWMRSCRSRSTARSLPRTGGVSRDGREGGL